MDEDFLFSLFRSVLFDDLIIGSSFHDHLFVHFLKVF